MFFKTSVADPNLPKMTGFGSESGSISQRFGSPDLDPDPYQNVTDTIRNTVQSILELLFNFTPIYLLYRLHTAILNRPLSSAATKKVQGPDTT